jgi:FixJ family two-component response regulator
MSVLRTSAHAEATVFVVDNDHAFRDSLRRWLLSAGRRVAEYADAESFLADCAPHEPGCVVLETRLPRMNGLELQDELRRRSITLPLVFVTGHGNVPLAVSAVKNGAVEFLEKPVAESAFLGVIERALKQDAGQRREHARRTTLAARLEKLTSREREIMHFVLAGKMNKTMADELRISIKTVEAHRAKVMQKLGVDSVAELVQFVIESGHARGGRW